MSTPLSLVPRYRIVALTPEGEEFECFTWRGSAEAGIARAKSEAPKFGRTDLTDFRAVRIEG